MTLAAVKGKNAGWALAAVKVIDLTSVTMGPLRDHDPPPRLGEHGGEVLSEAGFSDGEVDALVAEGALINPDS